MKQKVAAIAVLLKTDHADACGVTDWTAPLLLPPIDAL
jgi:hypothetical protein